MFWPFRKRDRSADWPAQKEFVFNPRSNGLELRVVTDAVRDGLGVELFDNDTAEVIADVFRHDEDNRLTFNCYAGVELPLSIVEQMVERAKHRLEPFEDDTPLSEATNQVRL